MKLLKKVYGVALIATLAAGCGGGGGGSDAGSITAYAFVTPKVSSQRIYAYTILDNSNNTINETVRDTVTSVNADGSYIYVHDDPTGNAVTVNGTTYLTLTESITANNSDQTLSYSYTPANSSLLTCTVAPHGAGPDYPLTVGHTWTLNYAVTCGGATAPPYTETGLVFGIESVTVPAGTFSAVKLQSTLTWTSPSGTTHTEVMTTWRDVSTAIVVKRVISFTYGGTALQNGYPVTSTMALQSQS